jgi:hypothetical protein
LLKLNFRSLSWGAVPLPALVVQIGAKGKNIIISTIGRIFYLGYKGVV